MLKIDCDSPLAYKKILTMKEAAELIRGGGSLQAALSFLHEAVQDKKLPAQVAYHNHARQFAPWPTKSQMSSAQAMDEMKAKQALLDAQFDEIGRASCRERVCT